MKEESDRSGDWRHKLSKEGVRESDWMLRETKVVRETATKGPTNGNNRLDDKRG